MYFWISAFDHRAIVLPKMHIVHCILLIEAIFRTTANSRLPLTLVSLILKKLWHWCNDAGKTTHPWNEAKPKWRRVSSGRPGCRKSYNFPSPTSSRRCSAICTPYFDRARNLYLIFFSLIIFPIRKCIFGFQLLTTGPSYYPKCTLCNVKHCLAFSVM